MKSISAGLLLSIACSVACVAWAEQPALHNVMPTEGYVPDAATAIRIAVAVWEPIYGKEQIAKEQPYRAKLTNGVWVVEGSLPEGWKGGVAVAEISKETGTIIRVSHGK